MNFRNKYVLAIDQGTTSSRAILFSHQGNIITFKGGKTKCVKTDREEK